MKFPYLLIFALAIQLVTPTAKAASCNDRLNKIKDAKVPFVLLNKMSKAAEDHGAHAVSSLALVDYSRPSDEARFFIIDLKSGEVEKLHVAHPKASSSKEHPELATKFSNEFGSQQASLGLYKVDSQETDGRRGKYLKVRGLEPSNSNADKRVTTILGVHYVSDSTSKVGHTNGSSFPVDFETYKRVKSSLAGALLYAGTYRNSADEPADVATLKMLGCETTAADRSNSPLAQ